MKEELEVKAKAEEFLNFRPVPEHRLRHRTVVERMFSNFKDNFTGRFLRVKGYLKVTCHIMFGILALTADQVFRQLN